MRSLQLLTLGLFGVFALLTAFFQLRAGMKDGEASRSDAPDARDAGRNYSHMAGRCAVLAAVFLVICMIFGAMSL